MQAETKNIQFDRIRILESGQFVLECNINAEAEVRKLLCVRCDVYDVRAVAAAKQIAAAGKVGVKVVYETEGGVDSADYVTDFSKILTDESVTESTSVLLRASVADTETELAGSTVRVRTVVTLSPVAVDGAELEVFVSADGVCAKRDAITLTTLAGEVDRQFKVDDEYASGVSVQKILCYSADAAISKQTPAEKGLQIDGEICASVTYLSDGEVAQKNIVIPFCETVEAPDNASALLTVTVEKSSLTVGGKEGENVLALEVSARLSGFVFENAEESVVTDVYSPVCELDFSRPCLNFDEICGEYTSRERIAGSVDIPEDDVDAKRVLCAEIAENDLVSAKAKDGCITTEGVLSVCVVYEREDGAIYSTKIELPYALSHEARGVEAGDTVISSAACCDLYAKLKRGREIEVGAALSFVSYVVKHRETCVVTGLEEGAPVADAGDAIVVVSAAEGDTAWDIAKRLGVEESAVQRQNPSVGFPARGGEKIVVYRMLLV